MAKSSTAKSRRNVLGRKLSTLMSSTSVPVEVGKGSGKAKAKTRKTNSRTSKKKAKSNKSNKRVSSKAARTKSIKRNSGEASGFSKRIQFIPITKVFANPEQPRQKFDKSELEELASSIKKLGVIQPVLLRPVSKGNREVFEIVAGERRFRASRLAGLKQIPGIVTNLTDKETIQIALVENIQREDLNPIEEAQAYARLTEEFNMTQKDIAETVGRERASIANFIRLLNLPEQIQTYVKNNKLSMGHAKAILSVKEEGAQLSLAKKAITENLSVRALETIVSRVVVLDVGKRASGPKQGRARATASNPFPEVVDRMRRRLGTKVSLHHHNSGRGRIEIDYFSESELDRVVELICGN